MNAAFMSLRKVGHNMTQSQLKQMVLGVENDVLSSNGQPLESERKEKELDLVHEELEKRVASGRSALLLLP